MGILCGGSRLLCEGLSLDPCPLCDDVAADDMPEVSSSTAEALSSTGSDHDAPSELECTDGGTFEDCSDATGAGKPRHGAEESLQASCASCEGTVITAPPGIGPPGTWLWPHASTSTDVTDATGENSASRPESSVNSREVERVKELTKLCFGSDLIRTTVTWDNSQCEMSGAIQHSVDAEAIAQPGCFVSPCSSPGRTRERALFGPNPYFLYGSVCR